MKKKAGSFCEYFISHRLEKPSNHYLDSLLVFQVVFLCKK